MHLDQWVIQFYSFLKFPYRQQNCWKFQIYGHSNYLITIITIISHLKVYQINYDGQNSMKQLPQHYYQWIEYIFYHFLYRHNLQLIHQIYYFAQQITYLVYFNDKTRMQQINVHDLMFMAFMYFISMLDLTYLFLLQCSQEVSCVSYLHQNYFLHYLSYQQIHRFYEQYQLYHQFLQCLLVLHQFHCYFSNRPYWYLRKGFIIQPFVHDHIF